MDIGSLYLDPLANTSGREVLLITLRSSVITWPFGLYINVELVQVQSGGLDLKSSILGSRNTCLLLNIFDAILLLLLVYTIPSTSDDHILFHGWTIYKNDQI